MNNCKNLSFCNYHKHTSLSHRYNKDSPLVPMDYFKEYAKLGHKGIPTIYSTVEHGWQGNYFKIYSDLEKFNSKQLETNPNYVPIKFIFGTEAYWVKDRFEKDSSNCHIILLAKNDNGRKKINRAIYESFNSGYYYKNRMDLDILLSLPKDDIFVTTSCIAFWNKYTIDDRDLPFGDNTNIVDYSKIDEIVLKLFNHFTDFYLEVQYHNTQSQKELNKHIIELHNKYNIPIICGLDSHIINESQWEDREDLLKANKIYYEDENGWYMDMPNIEEIIKRFQEQGVLTDEEIYEAINNTNKTLEFEDIILDKSLKVPTPIKYQHLTQEERNQKLKDIVEYEWNEQYSDMNQDKIDEYITEINNNLNEVFACGMADYFLMNYEVMKLGQEKYGGILTPSGRGSGVSFFLNKILRFTKVDKINSDVIMYAERFLTATRILESHTAPDIDHNVSDRQPFIQAQKDIIGEQGTFDLLALGTLHYKSAFKMYSRAYNLDPQIANDVTKQISQYENAMKHAEDDEKEGISIYDYVDKEKYGNLINGCQQYMGIVDNLKAHPCGVCCYSGDAIEDIGVIMVKSESQGENAKETFVAVIESGTIDEFGILKQDYLIVDSIGLTYDIYKEIGIEPLSVNELLNNIKNDKKTWDIYKNGYTMCVNQCEQTKSTEKVIRYKPQNISELTQFISAIRPSFQSMYKLFENREHFDYGIKAFDDLIQDEFCDSSFILYQEHLMKVLGFAGFPMCETYTIIKAISKKKRYIIEGAKEKFIPNFAQAIINTKETEDINIALDMAKKVWQVVEDSAQYGFNSAHAYSMAIDSVTLAWQKAHYPLEFYKVCLQRYTHKGNKDKVSLLKNEMNKRNIKLKDIAFGDDNREFSIDRKNNSINQTMASIKNVQKIAPQILYSMSMKKDSYQNLFFIFQDLKNSELNKKTIDIIFKLNYFKEYGDINYITQQWNIYNDVCSIMNRLSECRQLKKQEIIDMGLDVDIVSSFCNKATEKIMKEIDNDKLMNYVYENYQQIVDFVSIKYEYIPTTKIEEMSYQIALNGYTDQIDKNIEDNIYIVSDTNTNQYGTSYCNLYHVCNGETERYKIKKSSYIDHPCDIGDIIKVVFNTQNKRKQVDGEWVEDKDNKETILKDYTIIKQFKVKEN